MKGGAPAVAARGRVRPGPRGSSTRAWAHGKAVEFIRRYQAEHDGLSPTQREIAAAVGYSHQSAGSRICDDLEQLGLIRRRHSKHRAIELLAPAAGAPA